MYIDLFFVLALRALARQRGGAAATIIKTPSTLILAEKNIDCDKTQDLITFPIIGNHRVDQFPVSKTSVVSDFFVNVYRKSFTAICELSRFATWGWMHL